MDDWIGYKWLAHNFGVEPVQAFIDSSRIGKVRAVNSWDGLTITTYPEAMRPEANAAAHLAFALKYEGIHLEFLARLFAVLPLEVMNEWISREPTGSYARRAAFLFEWLSGRDIDFPGVAAGNYVAALPDQQYITSERPVNVARWRVRDNLPGTLSYCPLVRRTTGVQTQENYDISAQFRQMESEFGVDTLRRSAVWLTLKESRSSFTIEHEEGQTGRIQRFMHVMEGHCGTSQNPLSPATLTELQREILGQNALHYGLRGSPVYVGESQHRFGQIVHYIAPHWNQTAAMLDGLEQFLDTTAGASTLVRAAVASFGFVYIHPFADGNGRISRFLINDILRRDGAVSAPYILPVSATIIRTPANLTAYDWALESFSKPFMRRYSVAYTLGEIFECEDGLESDLSFSAYDDAHFAWAYPDLTAQVEYLGDVIQDTIEHEMRQEARLLLDWHQARERVKEIWEAPDWDIDRVIRSIQENGGRVSSTLTKRYAIFGDEKLAAQIVAAVMGKDEFQKE
jgi:hypothetical protein